jgi:hypothetical protein
MEMTLMFDFIKPLFKKANEDPIRKEFKRQDQLLFRLRKERDKLLNDKKKAEMGLYMINKTIESQEYIVNNFNKL